jgi:SSS family solute:Na+ symporter
MGIFPILAWFVTMLLQGIPNAGIMQTVIASKTPGDAKKGVIFAAILMAPVGFMAAMFGIMAASKFPGLESSALALPSIVMALPPLVGGLLLSGLWAADVSTATGLMVSLSTMGTRDIVVRHIKPDMTDKQQLTLSKVLIAACTVAAYIMATTVSGVLSALMAALTIFSPFAILMTGMFLFPKTVKKSSGWVTLIAGLIAFVLAKYMMPSLAILGQPIYTVTIVSLVAYLIAFMVDKNQAPVSELFEEQETAA